MVSTSPTDGRGSTDRRGRFDVWAPYAGRVRLSVVVDGADQVLPMRQGDDGWWAPEGAPTAAVVDYGYLVDDDEAPKPDPRSRWQPEGIRGPSRVVDPDVFVWATNRPVIDPADLVVYELHVGTFTPEGTFEAAIEHLTELYDLGVTAVELMPVNEFPGVRGWGYDGTHISAAHHAYGGPDGLQRFVDAAHRIGLGVILDVVYNHVGASGSDNLRAFGPFFSDKYRTFWGDAINYDEAGSGAVREWVLQSAEGWLRDFHVDGLRVDACHAIHDQSARHLLPELTARSHATWPSAIVIAESGLNDPKVTRRRDRGGWGFDGDWADDFHHALRVLLTGETDGWYADYGTVAQLAKAYERPYVFDGAYSTFRGRRHGGPVQDRPVDQFVVFGQNHDQVGNRAFGDRLPAEARPLAALCVLLSPFTPMLFMGEEYGEGAPFQFFTDHIDRDIAEATRDGRRREFARFASFAEEVPDPQDPATFERSKLTRERDDELAELYRQLLRVRRELPAGPVVTRWDEDARWLNVERGGYTLVASFAATAQAVPCPGLDLVVATPGVRGEDLEPTSSTIHLPPLAGVLVR